jgi:uncharacterized protein DUF3846
MTGKEKGAAQAAHTTAKLIRVDGSQVEITSKGKKFTLEELQALVGGYIESVPHLPGGLSREADMICNEEGKLIGLRFNATASALAQQNIVGDVVVLRRGSW